MMSWHEKLGTLDELLDDDTMSLETHTILHVLRDVMEELGGIGATVLALQDELIPDDEEL